MVLDGLGLAGVAGGLHSLFSYNRENFMFDREMRQKQEFQILAFRNRQAELWRDDIRDIIGMTEKKMDSYLVIATLQLGMCVGLFCEGRLEPGTPPWLLAFYMLALGGAFMYLLMAVWFAMHASVVANCSSVRLLTQFVRLPVPTWEHLEDLRTYASAYESVDWQHMLRVPFTGHRGSVKHHNDVDMEATAREATGSTPAGAAELPTPGAGLPAEESAAGRPDPSSVADPWGLERHGQRRDLYELEDKHPALRAHIGLARKASLQYQCFDAYARVAMTFGTNQLLNAVAYYCLGYLSVQDGAIWPAWCIVILMLCIMITLINVDIALTGRERLLATILQLAGPVLGAVAVSGWVAGRLHFEKRLVYILPWAYAAHGLWLLWVLGAIGIEKQPNGSVLPTKFRAVLYLDVFGWLNGQELHREDIDRFQSRNIDVVANDSCPEAEKVQGFSADSADLEYQELLEVQKELRSDIVKWRSERLQNAMSEGRFGPATIAFGDGKDAASPRTVEDSKKANRKAIPQDSPKRDQEFETPVRLPIKRDGPGQHGEVDHRSTSNILGAASEFGSPVVKAFNMLLEDDSVTEPLMEHSDGLGTETPKDPAAPSSNGPRATHSVRVPPKHVFDPGSYAPPGFGTKSVVECDENEDIVGGQETMNPGKLPAKIFRLGTAVLAALWAMGLAYPHQAVWEIMTHPQLGEVFVEEERPVDTMSGREWEEMQVPGAMGTDPNGLPMFIPLPQKELPKLEQGELIDVEWPTHAGFFPRALSCDDTGMRLVVADDIGLYSSELTRARPHSTADNSTAVGAEAGRLLRGTNSNEVPQLIARFTRVDRCAALEGQALKDMSIVCTGTVRNSHCRVVVLLAVGPTLAECPLPYVNPDQAGNISDSGSTPVRRRAGGKQNHTWGIAHDWLHRETHKERVDALAVHSHCLKVAARGSADAGSCIFEAENVGCVVVGTSLGRILQLRGNMEQDRQLVPDRTIHQRPNPVTHGSLHVLSSGTIMALNRKVSLSERKQKKVSATAQAFDGEEGNLVGQWELPEGVDWLTLSGGGDSLLALGLRDRRDLQLYRFPVPEKIRVKREATGSSAEL